MKKSDVLKTFRKINEATTDGYIPSENTHLVNKQYVDDIATNKADDLEVAKALNKSSTIFTKDFEVVTAKISDIITYTRIIDNPDDATYKMVAFYCNLDKILDNTNKLDCYFVQIKYKYNGEYKIATCSSGIIYTSYMKLNMDNTITMSGTSNIANLEFSMEPNKIYQEDYSTIDSTTQCSIFIACGMCYINENNIDIIKDAEISVFLRRKNFLSLNNTGEYTPSSDYNPSTKKYVDDNIKALEDTNKYKLITCDDPLVINKTDITDIADATVTIDNLTGRYGNLVANEDGTWTYTLNGFMNGLETFTFTVGETTQDLVIVPYKEMVYNDNNAGIGYSGTWDVENNTKYSNGSAHYSSTSGSTATFTFTGTDVDVYSRTNKDVGRIIAKIKKVNSDGTTTGIKTKIIDNISESSGEGSYYQIPTLFFDNLDYGTYEVTIFVNPIKDSDGNVVRAIYYLDGIRVYNPLNITNLKINDLYRLEEKQNNFLHIDRKNAKYSPTHDYDPATKVYVDDLVNSNKINMCTDEEFDSMLTSKLVVNEDNDDLVFLQKAPAGPGPR